MSTLYRLAAWLCLAGAFPMWGRAASPFSLRLDSVNADQYGFTILNGDTNGVFVLQQTSHLWGSAGDAIWQDVDQVTPASPNAQFTYIPFDSPAPAAHFFRLKKLSPNPPVVTTTRISQLTGGEDRSSPQQLTGAEASGVTGGVTGTDLGFTFEYNGRLYFLFGDSREWPPDVCEPRWCGTVLAPSPVENPPANPEHVGRWYSINEWNNFVHAHGDGYDSMASAPIDVDPDQGIPVTFETRGRGVVFGQAVANDQVASDDLFSGPSVAANALDKWVLVMGNQLLVITTDGRVFAHTVTGTTIAPAYQLSGAYVAANPGDQRVLVMGNRLLVITSNGSVFAHDRVGDNIGVPYQLSGPSVAANPQDKWVFIMGTRIFVITSAGAVFVHDISGNNIGLPFQLSGANVATQPEDKWVLPMDNQILVLTSDGRLFTHIVSGNDVGVPYQLAGARVGANPRDRLVLVMGNSLLTLSRQDGIFRPTILDGQPQLRREGAISGFADGQTLYAFFTRRNWPLGCTDPNGCAHDDPEPGGKTVLAQSLDGGLSFQSVKTVSTTKFLWAIPAAKDTAGLAGLPDGLGAQAVFVWGTGRQNNDTGQSVPWNHSYPFLAVAPLACFGEQDGRVFQHDVDGNTIGTPFQLAGPLIAANPEDKWVFVMDQQIVVITRDGRVFAHAVAGNTINPAIQLTGPPVASRSQDKQVLVMGSRILVITIDGEVFAHDISGNTIGVPYQLAGPTVGALPQDKWLLAVGSRIVVITSSGAVFAHEISGNTIGVPFQLSGPPVAANPEDKRVLVSGGRLLVVTTDGRVFAHDLVADTISLAYQLSGPLVAARPVDQWLLAMDTRLLVITKQPWFFFAGPDDNGLPHWAADEWQAQPLPPFGPIQNGRGYLECLGYFSVRYIDAWGKWAMLFTCGGPGDGYNPANPPRGVYLRTASSPWGIWSDPQRIFDPADGYCFFMHQRDADENGACLGRGLNPAEESVRDIVDNVNRRAWGGEYAPYLLPSRYVKTASGQSSFYFAMSTWNPYQVVLMRTVINPSP